MTAPTPLPRSAWCCNFWFTLGAVVTGLYAIFAYGLLVDSVVPLGASVHPDMKKAFAKERPAIILHAICSGLALILGPFQVVPALRSRIGLVTHRILGRVYGLLCVVGSVTAIIVAQRAQGGLAGVIGFTVLGSLWLGSTVSGIVAMVALRNHYVHELAMQISCALAYSAVSLRIMLPAAVLTDFQLAYGVIAWLCWIVNLAVLAVVRHLPARSRVRPKAPADRDSSPTPANPLVGGVSGGETL